MSEQVREAAPGLCQAPGAQVRGARAPSGVLQHSRGAPHSPRAPHRVPRPIAVLTPLLAALKSIPLLPLTPETHLTSEWTGSARAQACRKRHGLGRAGRAPARGAPHARGWSTTARLTPAFCLRRHGDGTVSRR